MDKYCFNCGSELNHETRYFSEQRAFYDSDTGAKRLVRTIRKVSVELCPKYKSGVSDTFWENDCVNHVQISKVSDVPADASIKSGLPARSMNGGYVILGGHQDG